VHQELVIGGGQDVDAGQVGRHRDGPDHLRPVDEHDRAHRSSDGADRGDV
jgi:hypothetical protein